MLPCILVGESLSGGLRTSVLAPVSHEATLQQLACLQRQTCLSRVYSVGPAAEQEGPPERSGVLGQSLLKHGSRSRTAIIIQGLPSHRHTWLMRWCRSSCDAALALRLSGSGLLKAESPLSQSGREQQSLGCIGSSSRGASLRSSACWTYKARHSSCTHAKSHRVGHHIVSPGTACCRPHHREFLCTADWPSHANC